MRRLRGGAAASGIAPSNISGSSTRSGFQRAGPVEPLLPEIECGARRQAALPADHSDDTRRHRFALLDPYFVPGRFAIGAVAEIETQFGIRGLRRRIEMRLANVRRAICAKLLHAGGEARMVDAADHLMFQPVQISRGEFHCQTIRLAAFEA